MKKNKTTDVADVIYKRLEKDILDRQGLKHEWRQIEPDIKAEIRRTWIRIILSALNE